ncbi:MAG: TetR/AcrR family transcriptional regulator [Actinomycetota bacterium]|nr:TetR/AcrR family transcriptional regulator [Actinomycetota bacterium]
MKKRFDSRRTAILDTCARVFAENGYDGAGIDELCAATGLTAGGLYHYIGSKSEALLAVLEVLMDPLLDAAIPIAENDEPAADRCRELILYWVEHVIAHRFHMMVFSQERHLLERDRKQWKVIRSSRRKFETLLAGVLAEMRSESGSPADEESDQLILYALLGMVNYTPTWFNPKGTVKPAKIADNYFQVVKNSIEAGSRR